MTTKILLLGAAAAALAGVSMLDPAFAEPRTGGSKAGAPQGARAQAAAPTAQNDSPYAGYVGPDPLQTDWNRTWRGDFANDYSRFRGFFPWGGYPYWSGGY